MSINYTEIDYINDIIKDINGKISPLALAIPIT